ncbi:6508_t:CDS:2 [Funneliformis mosseae]|uniref:6508_t:CDS:1 n=1 Tax=Funneliformis mosseae TaxID=27381 RepID=A0A9N9GM23_FUNMO|nr:6508_t:CDS:2 [Funneliformis mosseae]
MPGSLKIKLNNILHLDIIERASSRIWCNNIYDVKSQRTITVTIEEVRIEIKTAKNEQ